MCDEDQFICDNHILTVTTVTTVTKVQIHHIF